MRRTALLSLAPMVLMALAACGPKAPNLDSRGRTIVCLGDSITYGVGAESGAPYPDPLVEDALHDILLDPALKSDTIHPNAQGYEQLAAAVADEVEPLIQAHRKAVR